MKLLLRSQVIEVPDEFGKRVLEDGLNTALAETWPTSFRLQLEFEEVKPPPSNEELFGKPHDFEPRVVKRKGDLP